MAQFIAILQVLVNGAVVAQSSPHLPKAGTDSKAPAHLVFGQLQPVGASGIVLGSMRWGFPVWLNAAPLSVQQEYAIWAAAQDQSVAAAPTEGKVNAASLAAMVASARKAQPAQPAQGFPVAGGVSAVAPSSETNAARQRKAQAEASARKLHMANAGANAAKGK